MTHLILPLSTLYYAHEEACRQSWLPRFAELEVRRFSAGSIPEGLPLIYHSEGGPVSEFFLEHLEQNRIFEDLARHGVEAFSFDLGPACSRSLSIFPLEPCLGKAKLIEVFSRCIDSIRKKFQGRILLENLPYYRTGLYERICDPDFITEILEILDVYLLLDLAHALCAADNLHIPRQQYLERLPLQRVRQLHLSGVYRNEFLTIDAHERPDQKELQWVVELLQRIPDKNTGVAIEYYRDLKGLEDAYSELSGLLRQKGLLGMP